MMPTVEVTYTCAHCGDKATSTAALHPDGRLKPICPLARNGYGEIVGLWTVFTIHGHRSFNDVEWVSYCDRAKCQNKAKERRNGVVEDRGAHGED